MVCWHSFLISYPSSFCFRQWFHENCSTWIYARLGDGQSNRGVTHLNFTLNPSGECFVLSKPNVAFSDSACFGNIPPDHSYGRISDGNPAWRNFDTDSDSNNVDLFNDLLMWQKNPIWLPIRILLREARFVLIVYFPELFRMYKVVLWDFFLIKNVDFSTFSKGVYLIQNWRKTTSQINHSVVSYTCTFQKLSNTSLNFVGFYSFRLVEWSVSPVRWHAKIC